MNYDLIKTIANMEIDDIKKLMRKSVLIYRCLYIFFIISVVCMLIFDTALSRGISLLLAFFVVISVIAMGLFYQFIRQSVDYILYEQLDTKKFTQALEEFKAKPGQRSHLFDNDSYYLRRASVDLLTGHFDKARKTLEMMALHPKSVTEEKHI